MFSNKIKILILVLIVFVSVSCSSHMFFKRGESFFEAKDWDNSVKYLVKALDKDPDNIGYRLLLGKALISSSKYHYGRGQSYQRREMYELALLEYEKSLENNPENMQARQSKRELLVKMRELKEQESKKEQLKLKPGAISDNLHKLDPKISEKPYKLKFSNIDLKVLFKTLERSTGVSFLFHPSFKSKKIHINEAKVSILELLDRIMLQTKLFYKIIDSKTILIIPDKPSNRKKYDELAMRTFFINDGDPAEISKIIKSMTGIKRIILNKRLNTLTIKSTIKKLKLAEHIIRVNDKPKGEVLIDIEIIEVNKTRVNEYGIDLSSYRISQTFSPSVSEKGKPIVTLNDLNYSDASDYILNLPSINYKLLKSDRNSKIKAKPHIRALDGEKIELKVGDKVPIPTTSFVPQYGGSQVNNQPITSFQLQDIGISISLTPKIHHNGWVTIEMQFELTFISSPGDTAKNTPPTIGNRTVKSIIRLKDNETAIMAGLLRDTERKSIKSIPILSNIPILKSIFSGNSNEIEQTDIILTITPRIIRYPEINKSDLKYTWVGTELKPGLKKSAPPKFYTELKKELKNKLKQKLKKKLKKKIEDVKKNNVNKDADKNDEVGIKKELKKELEKKDNDVNKDSINKDTDKSNEVKVKKEEKKTSIPAEIIFNLQKRSSKKKTSVEMNVIVSHGRGIKMIKLELSFDSSLMSLNKLERSLFLKNNNIKSLLFKRFNNKDGTIMLNITFTSPIDIDNRDVLNFDFRLAGKLIGKINPIKVVVLDKASKVIETGYRVIKEKED